MKDVVAVDLFCGAGGLTRGLLNAGVKVVAGYDIDALCRYAYEANNSPATFVEKSVKDVTGEDLTSVFPANAWKVLVGCAPCQPFSTYYRGKVERSDERWPLLNEFGRLVELSKPHVVSMENVPGIQKEEVFLEFIELLKRNEYIVSARIVYCPDYGIAQTRKRLVVLASRLGPLELQKPSHSKDKYLTVRNVLSNLPQLAAGEKCVSDPLHACSKLSELNLKRIRASKPGKTWKAWPSDLIASCHEVTSGKTYSGVYGRMSWDKPSPTVTTQFFGFGNGRFGHPEQDRALSLREGAVLQTFPLTYKFIPPESKTQFKHLGKLIGNAVPVRLGEVIGQSIMTHVKEHCNG